MTTNPEEDFYGDPKYKTTSYYYRGWALVATTKYYPAGSPDSSITTYLSYRQYAKLRETFDNPADWWIEGLSREDTIIHAREAMKIINQLPGDDD